jgi:hypothetical protein
MVHVTYTSPVIGCDSIVYQVCDPSNLCDTAVIAICIVDSLNSNHPPVAVDDFASTDYVTPVVVSVLSNDSDPDGNTITVSTTLACLPTLGVATVNGNGTITYVPSSSANANTPDSFCYVICDNGIPSLCDTAIVYITIDNSVQAVNDTVTTGLFHPITIDVIANDFDPEGDSFSVTTVINLQAHKVQQH